MCLAVWVWYSFFFIHQISLFPMREPSFNLASWERKFDESTGCSLPHSPPEFSINNNNSNSRVYEYTLFLTDIKFVLSLFKWRPCALVYEIMFSLLSIRRMIRTCISASCDYRFTEGMDNTAAWSHRVWLPYIFKSVVSVIDFCYKKEFDFFFSASLDNDACLSNFFVFPLWYEVGRSRAFYCWKYKSEICLGVCIDLTVLHLSFCFAVFYFADYCIYLPVFVTYPKVSFRNDKSVLRG